MDLRGMAERGDLIVSTAQRMYLCAQAGCETVSNYSLCCPVCGSAVKNLAALLNRETVEGALSQADGDAR